MNIARRSHAIPNLSRVAGATALVLLLAACANPAGIAPHATLRDAASVGLSAPAPAPEAGAQAQPAVAADWWRAYGDAQLDALVEQALAGSPSLRLAQARLARAQAVDEVARAALLPRVGAEADVMRQRFTENGLYPPPLAGSVQDTPTLQLNGSWELDFFGKNQAALDAALGSERATEADAQAARVLLASQVVRTYLQLARQNDQLVVAERTLAQRTENLALVRDRVSAGLDTRLELHQSEGGLPEARQQIEALREQMTWSRNALAALVAQPQAASGIRAVSLATLRPQQLPDSLPADLLGRRADILAARWRVEAATQDMRSARAQFYPNISLTGFIGLSSFGMNNLLQLSSRQWGIGPALSLPVFDAGRLRANLRGKAADLDASVESYNSAIIDAVHEVADQLASARSITLQQREQQAAQQSAEGAYDIAVQRYRAGLGNYLNVLTAESSVLAQRRQQVDLAARALDVQAQLARALGGGYVPDAAVPPAAEQIAAQGTAKP